MTFDHLYHVIFIDHKYVVTVRASTRRYAKEEAIKTLQDRGILKRVPDGIQVLGRIKVSKLKIDEPEYTVRRLPQR